MTTDLPSSFNTDVTNVGGFEMAQRAASDCYKKSGYSAQDVDVVELHDCFAPTEVIFFLVTVFAVSNFFMNIHANLGIFSYLYRRNV